MENSKEPAFPFIGEHTSPNGNTQYISFGLTKREYYAAIAMQGLLTVWGRSPQDIYRAIELSIIAADELGNKLTTPMTMRNSELKCHNCFSEEEVLNHNLCSKCFKDQL